MNPRLFWINYEFKIVKGILPSTHSSLATSYNSRCYAIVTMMIVSSRPGTVTDLLSSGRPTNRRRLMNWSIVIGSRHRVTMRLKDASVCRTSTEVIAPMAALNNGYANVHTCMTALNTGRRYLYTHEHHRRARDQALSRHSRHRR